MKEPLITGVGISDFGKFPHLSEEVMAQAAILRAVRDAGVQMQDIQAFYCGNVLNGGLPGQRVLRDLPTRGEAVYNIDNACSSGATALNLALQALRAGQYDTVVVFGMDHLSSLGGGALPMLDKDWNSKRGMIMPALYAMRANRYMHEYCMSVGTLADVAVKNRRHGMLNPIAKFCKPVRVRASVVQSGLFEVHQVDMTEAEITRRTAKLAYDQAGVGPTDLSLMEVHDAFTISELLYYEALGLCGRGEAPALLASGATTLGGRIPVNPSGGLLAKGHPPGATGVAQVVEVCEQLQQRAGKRQVAGARLGLTQVTGGGIWGVDHAACSIHILELA